jgi:hypothetical protein
MAGRQDHRNEGSWPSMHTHCPMGFPLQDTDPKLKPQECQICHCTALNPKIRATMSMGLCVTHKATSANR